MSVSGAGAALRCRYRNLPDATTGLYPANPAENAAATKATALAQGGQQYNRVCLYARERLVRTCLPPLPGKTVGRLSACGCGPTNFYVDRGFFRPCGNTFATDPNLFGGAQCATTVNRIPNTGRKRRAAPAAQIVVGRPSNAGNVVSDSYDANTGNATADSYGPQ